MVTIKDIAREVGVSATTVSNVINGNNSKVSVETAEKIKSVIKEKKYVSNMGARMLAKNKSNIIGIIISKFTDLRTGNPFTPFVSEIIGVIEKEIRSKGYYTMLYSSEESEDIDNLINKWNVDGIITIGLSSIICRNIARKLKIPSVYIDCYFKETEPYINIRCDDEKSSYDIISYLIGMGHSKIAYIYDCNYKIDDVGGVGGHRLEGYKKAMRDNNLDLDESLIIYGNKNDKQSWLDKIYSNINNISAIAFCYDYYAIEAMLYLREKGLNIPDDISIVGFDDIDMAKYVYPPLTTIHQGIADKGFYAVEQLFKQINNVSDIEKCFITDTYLVERESVKDIRKYKSKR